MSIVYSDQGFLRLLFRWRGSLWRLVWRKLLIFLLIYYAINFVYRFALPEAKKEQFERIVIFLGGWSRFIPITFLLGFYVSFVVKRWWEQLLLIQYPDKFLLFVA